MKVKLLNFNDIELKNPFYEFTEYNVKFSVIKASDLVKNNTKTYRSDIIEFKLGSEKVKIAGGCHLSVGLIDFMKFQEEQLFLFKQDIQILKEQREKLKNKIFELRNRSISDKLKEIWGILIFRFKNSLSIKRVINPIEVIEILTGFVCLEYKELEYYFKDLIKKFKMRKKR